MTTPILGVVSGGNYCACGPLPVIFNTSNLVVWIREVLVAEGAVVLHRRSWALRLVTIRDCPPFHTVLWLLVTIAMFVPAVL